MSKFKEKAFIGIDPGKNGGIAILNDISGEEVSFRCPKTVGDMFILFASGVQGASDDVDCFVEFVHAFPGQGVVSTFSFGQNLGQWEGVIASQEVDINFVNPRKWMDHYSLPPNHHYRHLQLRYQQLRYGREAYLLLVLFLLQPLKDL